MRQRQRNCPRRSSAEIECSAPGRRLTQEGVAPQPETAETVVNGFIARQKELVAVLLRRANLEEKVIKAMLELGQDFRLPALVLV